MPVFFCPQNARDRCHERPANQGRMMKMQFMQAVVLTLMTSAHMAMAQTTPYQVQGGNKVDDATLAGWRAWRNAACERCHGPNQEGMVGPSLIVSLKTLGRDDFKTVVTKGRVDRGMPNFDGSRQVMDNLDGLYGYLKGRSDGAIRPGRIEKMD
ncbi:cytochrome c [Methyloversatilis sp.]|uniref:c-type cytochrome n=1 Tax=Methyloversatilis sp. TaxID=2569862 RepID=UPI002734DC3D|nr:cytochrome c [Methyloversatilis sp.]MDP2870544.1 cytochrome c [Methyloversatilis sp.]MDP3457599.1 cytochrome c [Methyloversatilis sp.]MDP3578395.1 cytochrome c [Methyloversatilis sp.]